jgi:hypothetical protein
MDCTVTGSVVVASEEGKFKTYSKVEDGVKINDKLTLNYWVNSNSISLSLKRERTEKNIVIFESISTHDADTNVDKGESRGYILSQKDYNKSISFLSDYIRIKNLKELVLSRYYKNDWHGIHTYVQPLDTFTQTLTLNCRHTNDKMDAAFKIFTDYNKTN